FIIRTVLESCLWRLEPSPLHLQHDLLGRDQMTRAALTPHLELRQPVEEQSEGASASPGSRSHVRYSLQRLSSYPLISCSAWKDLFVQYSYLKCVECQIIRDPRLGKRFTGRCALAEAGMATRQRSPRGRLRAQPNASPHAWKRSRATQGDSHDFPRPEH
ncbi:hypothetical protein RRG08_017444, partial [Elysia crispata]